MRALLPLTALCLVVAGCGGDDQAQTRTVVRTIVQTVTVPAPATATAPGEPAGAPLPDGVVAADGTYVMQLRDADFTGENIVVDDEFPRESEWVLQTDCAGPECTIRMRRELSTGAFKSLELEPAPDRPNVFEADSSGIANCASDDRPPAKQRYSVKLNEPVDVAGRQTASSIDVYYTESTDGCRTSPARGTVSWRGALER